MNIMEVEFYISKQRKTFLWSRWNRTWKKAFWKVFWEKLLLKMILLFKIISYVKLYIKAERGNYDIIEFNFYFLNKLVRVK